MVWVLAVTETVSYAALFYCFAVMVVPMRRELDATVAELSLALTVAIAVNGALAVPVGRWVDRHGARAVMAGGSLLGAASVVAWSRAEDLWQLHLAFVGIGAAGAMVLYEPAFAVVNTWFDRDRRAALLTITVVAGFSSTVFLPVSQALTDAFGWRTALLVLAALLASCALPQAVVLRRAPADLGLAPDGGPVRIRGEVRPAAVLPGGSGARSVWRPPSVRWLTLSSMFETLAVTIVAVHLVAYLRDTGSSASHAALSAGAIGILSVAGRLIVTGLSGRWGLGRLAAALVAAQAVGVVVLLVVPGLVGLGVFVVLFGAGYGVMTIARPALLGTYVPSTVFASVSGGQALARNVGRVVAPALGGALVTAWGYDAAFGVVAACALASSGLLVTADRGRA